MVKDDDGKPHDAAIEEHALDDAMNDDRPSFLLMKNVNSRSFAAYVVTRQECSKTTT